MLKIKRLLVHCVSGPILSYLLLFNLSGWLTAQPTDEPIIIGHTISIKSEILDEERQLMIYLPHNYERSSDNYPVFYILDGETHFNHNTGMIDRMSKMSRFPNMIVVGIANVARDRDMVPTFSEGYLDRYPTGGGAEAYQRFITEELQPFIRSKYRTLPFDLLMGESLAGFFLLYLMQENPDAFQAYICVSPGLWGFEELEELSLQRTFENLSPKNKFFFLTVGNEGKYMVGNAHGLMETIKKYAHPDLNWRFKYFEREFHHTINLMGVYEALHFIWDGFMIENWDQILGDGNLKAFEQHFSSQTEKYGVNLGPHEWHWGDFAWRSFHKGKYQQAKAAFTIATERYPDGFGAYHGLGETYERLGDLVLAKKYMELAISKCPVSEMPAMNYFKEVLERIQKKTSEN